MPSCEDADRAAEAFYDALLDDNVHDLYENAPCGYLSTSPDGTIVKVNETFLGWCGYLRADLVGRRRFPDLLTAGGRIFYETHIAPMLRMQERVREIAVELRCVDGRRLPVLVNAVLKRDAAGQPAFVRIAVFDATERRAYERELLQARQRAEESEARARLLAQTLQSTLIPPEPPAVPGLDVAAVYRPAGAGDEVGGDFYDVFETAPGEWAVVLGDVCGKGAAAASVTALARYTMRAAAVQDASPRHVLQSLNDAILRQHGDRHCTAVHVRVRTAEDSGALLTVSAGGHLPPLLVRPGVPTPEPVGRPGTLLGVFHDIELHETDVRLDPGSMLVLYTDGVTEGRDPSGRFYGDDRLRDVLRGAHDGSSHDVVDALAGDVLAFQDGTAHDDIAIVVLKAP